MAARGKNDPKDGLGFIKNTALRKNINGSIEYMYLLYGRALAEKDKDFKAETYRVIVLYAASIIEALFLYAYKQQDRCLTRLEYKTPTLLSAKIFHKDLPDSRLVVAAQIQREVKDQEVTFDKLIDLFQADKLMPGNFLRKIKEIKDIRNTFHLSKSRKGIKCDIKSVESSSKILVHTLKKIEKIINI